MDLGSLTAGAWLGLLAAALMLGLAAWLARLQFASRVHRSMALLFLLMGLHRVGDALWESTDDLAARLMVYAWIAIPFAAIHAAMRFRQRYLGRPPGAWGRVAPWALLAGCLTLETLYLRDHGLFYGTLDGPLLMLAPAIDATFLGIAWVFARDAFAAPSAVRRRALVLAALGFALPAAYGSASVVLRTWAGTGSVIQGREGWVFLAQDAALLPLGAAAALAGWTGWRAQAQGDMRRLGVWSVAVLALPLATAAGVAVQEPFYHVACACFSAGWAIATPLLVGYALGRHQLFGTDMGMRLALRGGTVGGLVLAGSFMLTKVVEGWTDATFGNWGILVGGAIAGLLLFLLSPLQRLAERLMATATPAKAGPQSMKRDERLALYKDQVELVWHDGQMSRKERLMVDRLRERLGLSAEETVAIEAAVTAR